VDVSDLGLSDLGPAQVPHASLESVDVFDWGAESEAMVVKPGDSGILREF
jgi:hypothetical protein